MYRLAADVFNDAAMVLDCLSPAFPKASRVALLSLSSVLRSLCGVAAGSSKASLSAHFATQGNLGELNAVRSDHFNSVALIEGCMTNLALERLQSRNRHLTIRNARWQHSRLSYHVQDRNMDSTYLPSRYPPRY